MKASAKNRLFPRFAVSGRGQRRKSGIAVAKARSVPVRRTAASGSAAAGSVPGVSTSRRTAAADASPSPSRLILLPYPVPLAPPEPPPLPESLPGAADAATEPTAGNGCRKLLCEVARAAVMGAVAAGCIAATVGQWGSIPLAIGAGIAIGLVAAGVGWAVAGREPTRRVIRKFSAWLQPTSERPCAQASERIIRSATAYLAQMPKIALRVAAGGIVGECALLAALAALFLVDLADPA